MQQEHKGVLQLLLHGENVKLLASFFLSFHFCLIFQFTEYLYHFYFSDDFAQFASNFRLRLPTRESRGHRAPVNGRLRSRCFRGRHTPYTNLWESLSPSGARREASLTEFSDFTPRPVPSGDNSSPIIIDEEVFILLI